MSVGKCDERGVVRAGAGRCVVGKDVVGRGAVARGSRRCAMKVGVGGGDVGRCVVGRGARRLGRGVVKAGAREGVRRGVVGRGASSSQLIGRVAGSLRPPKNATSYVSPHLMYELCLLDLYKGYDFRNSVNIGFSNLSKS
ncbi:hypothetical protein FCV25MIE_07920 [Fagus crenata]